MTVTFRAATRADVHLLVGLAGGTGSGKTWSAMALATGLAGGKKFAVIDTEGGRASHYADDFTFDVAELAAPFRPDVYADAIAAADKAGYPVIVVDSMSHEWEGDGGILDWQEEEFKRMGSRDAVKMASWIAPKQSHRKFVTRLLQVRAHVILCFRAAEKVEMVRGENGKVEVGPKRTLTGLNGWVPISERNLPFELTVSLLLAADSPGKPLPIKLPERLRQFVPIDRPVNEETGRALASWAAGATPATSPALASDEDRHDIAAAAKANGVSTDRLKDLVLEIAGVTSGKLIPRDKVDALINAIRTDQQSADPVIDDPGAIADEQPVQSRFQIPASARGAA